MRIEYVESIPPLPDSLIETHDIIAQKLFRHFYVNEEKNWDIDLEGHKREFCFSYINQSIVEWAQTHMPFKLHPADSTYFVMYKDIAKHSDRSNYQQNGEIQRRSDIGINYVLSSGGPEVYTMLYDSDGNVIQKINIQEKRWVKFPITTDHSVANITHPPRIVIRLTPTIDTRWEDIV